jgi:hypothetical protein
MKVLIMLLLALNCGQYIPPKQDINKDVRVLLFMNNFEKIYCSKKENMFKEKCMKHYDYFCDDNGDCWYTLKNPPIQGVE